MPRSITLALCLLLSAQLFSQSEKRDTIWGVALVIDTFAVISPSYILWGDSIGVVSPPVKTVSLTTSVVQAYSVSCYSLIVDSQGHTFPRVNDVRYYDFFTCREIPIRSIFTFKQQ